MELVGCPEASVRNYHYTLRNNGEDHRSYLLHGGSLKPRTVFAVVWCSVLAPF